MTILTLAVILLLIMDPVGNIASFFNLLREMPAKQQRMIIIREMFIALAAMVAFNFFGEFIFNTLSISEAALRITSGAILLLVGLKILFPSTDSLRANLPSGEPFITPLAIPLIAGPSLLATIMLFAHLEPSVIKMMSAIFIAWMIALIILLSGSTLQRILGNSGLMACERLMGMVLILLAIQRFLEGIQHFITTCQLT